MQFLRTLFWALLVGVLVAFSFNNWKSVDVTLWGGLIVQVNLPLLLFVTFLFGLLPMQILHQATRWRLKQRLNSSERALNDLRAIHAPVVAPAIESDPEPVIAPPMVEPDPIAIVHPDEAATPLDPTEPTPRDKTLL